MLRVLCALAASRHAYPRYSASTPGAIPGSARPTTSANSTSESSTENSESSTSVFSFEERDLTSPLPVQPTARLTTRINAHHYK